MKRAAMMVGMLLVVGLTLGAYDQMSLENFQALENRVAAMEHRIVSLNKTLQEQRAAVRAIQGVLAAQSGPLAPPTGARVQPPPVQQKARAAVYVTQDQSKRRIGVMYHRRDCRRLRENPKIGHKGPQIVQDRSKGVAIPLDEARRRGYTPCRLCNPPE